MSGFSGDAIHAANAPRRCASSALAGKLGAAIVGVVGRDGGYTAKVADACVIVPTVIPALLTGFALAFARALGEYGSVVFISGNMPMRTEIASLLIITKLEQYDYNGATALALVMLVISFLLLSTINIVQSRVAKEFREG